MSKKHPPSDEAWEERLPGSDENFIEVADSEIEQKIDAAAGTKLISIRMQESLIQDMKEIAALNGTIGYQTLMKQILQRFVESEKKQIYRKLVSEELARVEEAAKKSPKSRKRA